MPVTTTTPQAEDAGVSYRTLVWLAVATFSMGIDGYVLAGLLPQIGHDLHVSPAAAGQLMAVFALTSALAGPVLAILTGRWERRATIAVALAVFIVGNLVMAAAPTYAVAFAGRIVAALGGSLLNAVVSGYVIATTPERHRGTALSVVLGGWMAATALGVPVGLLLGQSDWRLPLIMVAVVGAVALVGILLRLPRLHLPAGSFAERVRPLALPRIVAGLLVTVGILCASYACFTYAALIIGPTLAAGWLLIVVMFGYGAASMAGNAVTGRLADRFTPVRVLTVLLLLLLANAVVAAVVLGLATGATLAVASVVWFLVAGVGNGGAGVPQQARLAAMAPDATASAAAGVMALNGSAISLGSALGSALGGLVLTLGVAPTGLPVFSAVILAGTLTLHLLVAKRSRRRGPSLTM